MAKVFPYTEADLVDPVLQAIRALGGSASTEEIEEQVIKLLKLPDDQVNAVHREGKTKLSYRLAWARNYLKRGGFVENSARGVWSLTPKGQAKTSIDGKALRREVRGDWLRSRAGLAEITDEASPETDDDDLTWQENIVQLLQGIKPEKFERFVSRGASKPATDGRVQNRPVC